MYTNFLHACVSDLTGMRNGVRLPRELTDSPTVPQGSLPHGIEVRTPSPVLAQRPSTEHFPPPVASVTPIRCMPTTALQLHSTRTAIRDSLPHITSTVSTLSTQIPTTSWMSLCHNLQSKQEISALLNMAHQR